MTCERGNKKFEISSAVRPAFSRNAYIYGSIVLMFCLLAFSRPASSATLCGVPGKDGTASPSGVINTYYPGTSSVSAGATSIPVGSPSGNSQTIGNGDLLLVIQMQDANINTSNNSNYGAGAGTGSGYTALNETGVYEYVSATGPVSGGSVPIASSLANSYRIRAASGTNGQSTYQVIRVPQYSSAIVSATVNALNWNGSVGGIVAMDVAGALTINSTITADGAGFRGGLGRQLTGGAGANTDYRTSYSVKANGSKGEGIAGTPQYMNSPSTFNGAPAQVAALGSGYPDGSTTNASYAQGAPGNAGGGGTDGHPAANDQNSGGGGGGNYAAGAKGGNSWNSNLTVGGVGGSAVAGLAFNRIVMGGGGGAGTTNDGTADNTTYANPPGLACTASAGACSSGAPGGGIVLVRANSINGSGSITANGGSGYNTGNDSAGGGGAGGSVVLYTQIGGSVTVTANGGDGGNAWRSDTGGLADRHGPGGGGSGGFIAYSPSTGFAIAATVNPGISGKTTTLNDSYGSTASSGGIYTFLTPNTSGPLPGAACLPNLTVLKEISTDGGVTFTTTPATGGNPGATLTYRITVTNGGTGNATSVVIVDPKPTYTSYVANSAKRATGAPVTYAAAPTTLTDLNAADDGFDYGVTTPGVATYSVGTIAPGAGNAVQLFFKVTVN